MMNQTGLIYIADDEKEIRELIQKFLEEAGHKVEVFENGEIGTAATGPAGPWRAGRSSGR